MTGTIFYIFLYATCNVFGAALIKLQLQGTQLTIWNEWLQFIFSARFMIAFLMIVFSALALFKALSTNQFSLVIPVATGVNFILTAAVGYFLFQERLSMISYIGFSLIVSGIFIISANNHVHA